MKDAEHFARFILEHYPNAREWIDPVDQAGWYIAHGFVVVVLGDKGEIVSLCSGRPVERPGLGVLPYYYNEKGTCLHIDLWIDVSGDDSARVALMNFARVRFPMTKTITMFRHFESAMHVYDAERFWKGFEKLKRIRRRKKETAYGTI